MPSMDPGSNQIRPHVRKDISTLKDSQLTSHDELLIGNEGIRMQLRDLHEAEKAAPLQKLELLGLAQAALQVLTRHMQLLEDATKQPGLTQYWATFAHTLDALCRFIRGWLDELDAHPALQSSMRDFMVSAGG